MTLLAIDQIILGEVEVLLLASLPSPNTCVKIFDVLGVT
jgi:hypothetical protein